MYDKGDIFTFKRNRNTVYGIKTYRSGDMNVNIGDKPILYILFEVKQNSLSLHPISFKKTF